MGDVDLPQEIDCVDALSIEDVDMDESILLSDKQHYDQMIKAADDNAVAIFEQETLKQPNDRMAYCRRCQHVGDNGAICYNCVSYFEYEGDDVGDETETDSQIAEQLASTFCHSPTKGSPIDDTDDNDDSN
jgi:hypothetical protein